MFYWGACQQPLPVAAIFFSKQNDKKIFGTYQIKTYILVCGSLAGSHPSHSISSSNI